MRCIDSRQKILLALLKSEVKFNKAIVLSKTLKNSKINTYILSEIKELLRKGVFDEDLIEVVTRD